MGNKSNEKLNSKYFEHLAMLDLKSVYSYKILMLLLANKTYTQQQLSEVLEVPKQSITKPIKELENYGLIQVDRIEGRNKFLRTVTDTSSLTMLIPGQTKML